MDAAILDVYGNQSAGTGSSDPVQLSGDAWRTDPLVFLCKKKKNRGIE